MDHSEPKRPPPICEGFLEKQTHNTIKRWLVRYFELHNDALRYYDAPHSRKLKGEIQLNDSPLGKGGLGPFPPPFRPAARATRPQRPFSELYSPVSV